MSLAAGLFRRLAITLSLTLGVGILNHTQAQTTTTTKSATDSKVLAPKAKAKGDKKLDLNTASADELAELPGVGPVTLKKIIDGRPYQVIADLEKAGVPVRTVEEITPLVTVSATPKTKAAAIVDLNKASLEELETLPGVGPTVAKEIIAARPFKSVDELEKIKGLGETRIAALKPKVKVTTAAPATPKVASPNMTKAETKKDQPTAKAKTKTKAKEVVENENEVSSKAKSLVASGKKININTASHEALMELPGIGPVKSKAIVAARPFKTLEDIKGVNGIGDATFGHLKDFITIK